MNKLSFVNKLQTRIDAIGNHLCVGIDPHVDAMPHFMRQHLATRPQECLTKLCTTIIDAAVKSVAVKFQSAFFEAQGLAGLAALKDAITYAQNHGLITILDAKRGDISSTMRAYGVAAFDIMAADCLTVTPYMGTDVVEPLVPWLEAGKGVYLVWLTSNPSASLVQEVTLSDSQIFRNHVYRVFQDWQASKGIDGAVGYVLGATKLSEQVWNSLPPAPNCYLIPGIGAQGGVMDDRMRRLLLENPASLITISRAATGLDPQSANSSHSWDDYKRIVEKSIESTVSTVLRI